MTAQYSRNNDSYTATLTPSEGQSVRSIVEDFDRTAAYIERKRARGVTENRFSVHSRGRFGWAFQKEVGPPAWRFPRIVGYVNRHAVGIGIGWRFTLYTAMVMQTKSTVR